MAKVGGGASVEGSNVFLKSIQNLCAMLLLVLDIARLNELATLDQVVLLFLFNVNDFLKEMLTVSFIFSTKLPVQ